MRNLIDTSISWDRLGDHERQEYQYWITDAVINSETGVLTITLRLNFVMPVIDMEKLSGIILLHTPGQGHRGPWGRCQKACSG